MGELKKGKNRVIGGVCDGISNYLNIDVVIIRLIFVFGLIFGYGSAALIYLILWIIMPEYWQKICNYVKYFVILYYKSLNKTKLWKK